MYQRSDGHQTGNHQQGKAFDRSRGMNGGVKSAGSGGGKSKEASVPGPKDLGAEHGESTQPHPVTGVHEIHVKHHGDGRTTIHTFHQPIEPHPQAHDATVSEHNGSADMHGGVDMAFPSTDGVEAGGEPGEDTLSGITGGMPGQGSGSGSESHRRY